MGRYYKLENSSCEGQLATEDLEHGAHHLSGATVE